MLDRKKAACVIIDLQSSLFKVMVNREEVLKSTIKLLEGAKVLGLPVVLTEQVKLGETIPEIKALLPGVEAIVKESFSCWGEERFRDTLLKLGKREIILAGIEAHICVYQTARALVREGFGVHVAADCVSSRVELNREVALRTMVMDGVRLTTAEMVLFELLQTAGDPQAREVFRIVK